MLSLSGRLSVGIQERNTEEVKGAVIFSTDSQFVKDVKEVYNRHFKLEEDNHYFIAKTQEQGQAAVEDLILEAEIRGLDEIAKAINEYVALGKPVRANLNFIERTLRDTIISNGSKIK